MKSTLLFLLSVSLLVSSCCTKKDCEEATQVHISLHGFALSEVDTIYTTGYAIGSKFTQVIRPEFVDTVRTAYDSDSGFVLMPRDATRRLSEGLADSLEWKVYIPAINKTLLINNYGYSTFKCNQCFPYSPPENKKHSLSTCSVNDVTTYVHDVAVRK